MKAIKDMTAEEFSRFMKGEKILSEKEKKEEERKLIESNKKAFDKYFRPLKRLSYSWEKEYDEDGDFWKVPLKSREHQECHVNGISEIVTANIVWDFIPYDDLVSATSWPYLERRRVNLPCHLVNENGKEEEEIRWGRFEV